MKKIYFTLIIICLYSLLVAQTKIRDITYFSGMEVKQLIGYGLVIGLNGTGDGGSSQMTTQSIQNMMERFGITVPLEKIKPSNVASVMVTGFLPAFAKSGSDFDVTVSSVGDAKSLEGGTLLLTTLTGTDGIIYATAQGALSIGGFNTEEGNAKVRKNYTLVGRIPGGAIVEREYINNLVNNSELALNLHNPDFTTAKNVTEAINKRFRLRLATTEDISSISIIVPDSVMANRNLIGFISTIENLEVNPVSKAKVVINERTGTIVAGGSVKISQVAVSHGNLVVEIKSTNDNSEYLATQEIKVKSEQGAVMVLSAATVQELAATLNQIKVSPRDLISIFQSIKAAGALQADLIIM